MIKYSIIFLLLFPKISLSENILSNDELKYYARYFNRNHQLNKPISDFRDIDSVDNKRNLSITKFFKLTFSDHSKFLSYDNLKLPDNQTLVNIKIINLLSINLFQPNDEMHNEDEYLAELQSTKFIRYDLVSNYYNSIFISIQNKIRPFDLSDYNFNTKNIGAKDIVEENIFILEMISAMNGFTYGLYFFPTLPNYSEILSVFSKYPKFNGKEYYQLIDFDFEDFKTREFFDSKEFLKLKIWVLFRTLFVHINSLYQNGEYEKANRIKNESIISLTKYDKYIRDLASSINYIRSK